MTSHDIILEQLVNDLQPVRPFSAMRAMALVAAFTAVIIGIIGYNLGFRGDLLINNPDPMFLLRGGTLLLLGMGTAHAVLSMASPAVGKSQTSWEMALASAALFPLAALIVAFAATTKTDMMQISSGLKCLQMSMLGGLAVAVPMVLRLRKGAPTSLSRAGWLTGVASGGLGAFAFGFHCPFNDIVYIGIWYTLAVGLCAIAGRLIVPHLIKW
jgi:hypothetical protein